MRRHRAAAAGILAAVLAMAVTNASQGRGTEATTVVSVAADYGRPAELHASSRHTAIVYDASLAEHEVLARAEEDAALLGFPLTRTLAVSRMIVVEGAPDQVRAALAKAELPATGTRTAFFLNGYDAPRFVAVPTGKAVFRFRANATEAEKAAFAASNGLAELSEIGGGFAVARLPETGNDADLVRMGEGLAAASNGLVTVSAVDLAKVAEPQTSDSREITDPSFPYQWHHAASAFNNFSNAFNDEDMDTARAWQVFGTGDSTVRVAVFDSGTDLTNPDLAANLPSPAGEDLIDGDTIPRPLLTTFGAHGTTMASLIAAPINGVGVVGVAPTTTLYTVRIFGSDYSASTANITTGVVNAALRQIDIGCHAYSVGASQELEDNAFQFANESGRDSLGMINVASGGSELQSFLSYPGRSSFTVGVTAMNSEGNRLLVGNASVTKRRNVVSAPATDYFESFADTSLSGITAGIATGDITGADGLSRGVANTASTILDNGNTVLVSSADTATLAAYVTTSFPTAMVSGVAALMLSDPRYSELPSLTPGKGLLTNQITLESTVIGWMSLTVDRTLSPVGVDYFGQGLNYIDSFNSWLGHGRVNAMNPLVPTGEILAPPSPRLNGDLLELFSIQFGAQDPNPANAMGTLTVAPGVVNPVMNLEPFAETTCGFEPPDDPVRIEEDGLVQVTVGPVYEGVPFLGVEDPNTGRVEVVAPDPFLIQNPEDPWDATRFLYVWSDSQPTTTTSAAEGIINNPEGRYLADNSGVERDASIEPVCAGQASEAGFGMTTGRQLLSTGALIAFRPEGGFVPIWGEITLQHELGTQNASLASRTEEELEAGDSTVITTEIDRILFTIEGEDVTATQPLVITGDSTPEGEVKAPIRTATFIAEEQGGDDERLFPEWDASTEALRPQKQYGDLVYRTYRGFLGYAKATSADGEFPFRANVLFQPNESFLPSYDLEIPEGPDGFYGGQIPLIGEEPQQDTVLRLDYGGWRLLGLRLYTIDTPFAATYFPTARALGQEGRVPEWSTSGRELFFTGDSGVSEAPSAIRAGTRLPSSRNNAFYPNPNLTITAHDNELRDTSMHPGLPLLAVAKGPSGSDPGGVFLMTEDGLNETPVDLSRTSGATGVQWSRTGVLLAVTGPDWIRAVSFGNFDAFQVGPEIASTATVRDVLPSGGGRLSEITDPAFDASSGMVLVSARLDDAPAKNIFAFLRVAALPFPNINEPTPLLRGWEPFDQVDLETDNSGQRLLFATNRNGDTASENYTILSLRNFTGTLFAGNEPEFQEIPIQTTELTNSFRAPRLSPEESAIAFVGNPDEAGSGTVAWSLTDLEAAIQPGATPAPTPIPSPTGTPVPPTPTPDDRVSFAGEINFDVPQGWVFGTANDLTPAVGTTTGAALTIRSNETGPGNNNTFGFFTSPARTLTPQRDTIYLYRAILRGASATRAAQPTIRLRANSDDFQLAYETEINSLGSLSEVPGSSPTAVDLLIEPPAAFFELPADLQNFRLSFDLLNFLDDDDPQGGAALSRVEIYALKPGAVKQSTFEYFSALDRADERALWEFATSPEIPGAERIDSATGLAMSVDRADRAFGFFTSRPGVVAVGDLDADTVILRMKGRVTTTVATDAFLNPDIRIRMNTGDFQRSSSALVTGNASGNITPQPGEPALMTSYLVLRSRPLSLPMFLSFDVYAFNRPGISDKPIILDEVQLESIEIPAYPQF